MGAGLDPIFRNHLGVVPFAAMKVKQGKTREIACAHVEDIGGETRIGAGDVMPVTRAEVLHANGLRDLAIEGVEDFRTGGVFVKVPGGWEPRGGFFSSMPLVS